MPRRGRSARRGDIELHFSGAFETLHRLKPNSLNMEVFECGGSQCPEIGEAVMASRQTRTRRVTVRVPVRRVTRVTRVTRTITVKPSNG